METVGLTLPNRESLWWCSTDFRFGTYGRMPKSRVNARGVLCGVHLAVVRGFGRVQEVFHVGTLEVPQEGGVVHPSCLRDALRVASEFVLSENIVFRQQRRPQHTCGWVLVEH